MRGRPSRPNGRGWPSGGVRPFGLRFVGAAMGAVALALLAASTVAAQEQAAGATTREPPAAAAQEPSAAPSPLLAGCTAAGAETAPLYLDRLRMAELQGRLPADPAPVQRSGSRRIRCDAGAPDAGAGPHVRLLPVRAGVEYRSGYPRESLNGLRWAGRGTSFQARAGAEAWWGPFSAAFAPAVAYHENQPFDILEVNRPGSSPLAWYWRPTNIDWPQRFGRESFWWSHPGDSYVRADAWGAAVGVSTETLRWGPARRNPLLMSGAAPGFPHVFIGTSGPADLWIARLSVEAVWGRLAESDFFDLDDSNDDRLLAGFVASLEPRGVPGLELGIIRAYVSTIPPEGMGFFDYITEPYTDLLTNRRGGTFVSDNELFSFFARWVFPESEAEVYAEFAREDQWDGSNDLILEPDHSAALTAGLQKLVAVRGDEHPDRLRVAGEITSMNFPETHRSGRPEAIFYTHSGVRQGYTHRGQLLGAPIGPSSDAQSLELDYLAGRWLAGLYLERVRYANDIYWQAHGRRYTYKGHDVEVTGGLRGAYLLPDFGVELTGSLDWSGRYNRDFIVLTSLNHQTGYERNVSLRLGASWTPASSRSVGGRGPASPPMRP